MLGIARALDGLSSSASRSTANGETRAVARLRVAMASGDNQRHARFRYNRPYVAFLDNHGVAKRTASDHLRRHCPPFFCRRRLIKPTLPRCLSSLAPSLSAALAAFVKFAVLPDTQTFAGLSLVLGAVLIPLSCFIALPWQPVLFTAATANFMPLLAPTNEMSYDGQQFYNSALAIMVGIGAAALAMRLLPPLSPARGPAGSSISRFAICGGSRGRRGL